MSAASRTRRSEANRPASGEPRSFPEQSPLARGQLGRPLSLRSVKSE
jgi:hypothetical protein